MSDELWKRIPNWLLGVALIALASIVGMQMYRGDALVCADGAIFQKTCPPTTTSPTAEEVKAMLLADPDTVELLRGAAGDDGADGSIGRAGRNATLPTGIVVASTVACGKMDGWYRYGLAEGRFIVGVGAAEDPRKLRRFDLFEESGEFEHELRGGEMPRHYHISTDLFDAGLAEYGISASPGTDDITGLEGPRATYPGSYTTYAGANGAHTNMPPYIALYFCRHK